jgi:hypothetical protein
MKDGDLPALVPVRDPQIRLLEFDFEVAGFRAAQTTAELPEVVTPGPSYLVAFGGNHNGQREPLHIDRLTARVLELSDGKRTISEIVRQLQHENHISEMGDGVRWIENLFVCGLVGLQEAVSPADG